MNGYKLNPITNKLDFHFNGEDLAKLAPSHYARDIKWAIKGTGVAADRDILQTPNKLAVDIDEKVYFMTSQQNLDLDDSSNWDTTSPTDYSSAANRGGLDFYLYACQPSSGDTPDFKLSVNSTVPSGYTTANSRKIGGFHCVCKDVGTIVDHSLSNFVSGNILTNSIWDLDHRPKLDCSPEGMTYDSKSQIWTDIYLTSSTGSSTASSFRGTISDNRNWMDFVDDGGAVGKRLLKDQEFQNIANNSNEETNIAGSADPVRTGGHSDTAGRRMISDIGCEDCAGTMWQWLDEQSYRYDGGTHTHLENMDASYTQNVKTSGVGPIPSWGYYNLPGSKGSIYRQGTYGDVKLLAGGTWDHAAYAGSRCRYARRCRWGTDAAIGCRLGAEPK